MVLGGGSCGLYGPWKFKRVSTCKYNIAYAHVNWKKGKIRKQQEKCAFFPICFYEMTFKDKVISFSQPLQQ